MIRDNVSKANKHEMDKGSERKAVFIALAELSTQKYPS
jgi:hypothetical protein